MLKEIENEWDEEEETETTDGDTMPWIKQLTNGKTRRN